MTTPDLTNAFSAQLNLVYDLKDQGANALASAGTERRKQLFDFLGTDLVKGSTLAQLQSFLNTDLAFRVDPAHTVAGVQSADGSMVLPLMSGADSVEAFIDVGLVSLTNFIASSLSGIPGATVSGPLEEEYTCKKWVWDPKLDKWVWEYNYTLIELNGTRLEASEISQRYIDVLINSPNPPTAQELVSLREIKPTYRLLCVVSLA